MFQNTPTTFGLISKSLHWLSALTLFGLFAAGYWMVDLDYYSQWYQKAPHWHQSVGFLLFCATLFRVIWRFKQPQPNALASHTNLEKASANVIKVLLYVLLFIIMVSGYLISTADDRAIEIFNWFSVSSLGELFSEQEEFAGSIHEYAAYTVIGLSLLHALAAIKHHIIDKDETLVRMIK